ncbi:aarF domain-containing protein kinase 1-like [Salvia splendens]|uniref:aarF domain-containing protein kinase 1-like n=1 Tax=Salvia splendens TaxID=180675 RepID=UPI001C25C81E|nr:aarF domain-containing protein kinase 1-like [Salvia splendens]
MDTHYLRIWWQNEPVLWAVWSKTLVTAFSSCSRSTGSSGWYQNLQSLLRLNLISFKRLKTQRAANNFKSNKLAKFPYVYWDFACKKVLTMEFCEGHKIDDLEYLKRMGINPLEVAKTLIDVFAEMIFVHGFLHGDPHPGNILVSPDRHNGFSLVILDHGIYKQLPEEFRKSYCHLWEALIRLDSQKIQHLGETFGVGKYARYFPVIFTGRTINSVRCIQIEDEYQIHSAEGNSGYYGVHKLRG